MRDDGSYRSLLFVEAAAYQGRGCQTWLGDAAGAEERVRCWESLAFFGVEAIAVQAVAIFRHRGVGGL